MQGGDSHIATDLIPMEMMFGSDEDGNIVAHAAIQRKAIGPRKLPAKTPRTFPHAASRDWCLRHKTTDAQELLAGHYAFYEKHSSS